MLSFVSVSISYSSWPVRRTRRQNKRADWYITTWSVLTKFQVRSRLEPRTLSTTQKPARWKQNKKNINNCISNSINLLRIMLVSLIFTYDAVWSPNTIEAVYTQRTFPPKLKWFITQLNSNLTSSHFYNLYMYSSLWPALHQLQALPNAFTFGSFQCFIIPLVNNMWFEARWKRGFIEEK